MHEVTHDKSLAKEERKRLQIENAANCNPKAKLTYICGAESSNNRNGRAIRFATNWYHAHLLIAQERNSSKNEATRVIVLEETELDEQSDQTNDGIIKTLTAVVATATIKSNNQLTGEIVGTIVRKRRQYCGVLQPSLLANATRHIFIPADRKILRVRIATHQAEKLKNQRIVVTVPSWPRTSRYQRGHFVRSLRPLGDVDSENEVILLEHDVSHSKFSEVLNYLPKMSWIMSPEDYAARVDLRDINMCSVDPPGCTHIDDTYLHCRELLNGNLEVGVHLAVVSHCIRAGTALDKKLPVGAQPYTK
uniref:Protein DIS3 homolog n=1 Tax=Glossina austeni TaxID=7395 RepID=A0A1A9V2M7_GLOAU